MKKTDIVDDDVIEFVKKLIGKPLKYGLKSPDTELYDFGFGDEMKIINYFGNEELVNEFVLHAICRFKIIWGNGVTRTDEYFEDTNCEKLQQDIQPVIGLAVKNVSLRAKNDLQLDFGPCRMVFATNNDGEESWRFFTMHDGSPHVVASSLSLQFDI